MQHQTPSLLTFNVEITHAANVSLSLASQLSDAIWLAAIARLRVVAISVHVVVEGELFAREDIALCKDAHAHVLADVPLCDVAVWVTAVVDETSHASLFCCIEVFVLLEHHEVEVRDALVVITSHALVEIVWLDDFTNVLVHERLCWDGSCCSQTEAFLLRLDDFDVGILFALEALILTEFRTPAVFAYAFYLCETIDAAGFVGTRTRDVVSARPVVAFTDETLLVTLASTNMTIGVPVLVESYKGGECLFICAWQMVNDLRRVRDDCARLLFALGRQRRGHLSQSIAGRVLARCRGGW